MKYDVFISYRRTASETATLIAEKLRSFGYRVFLDVETLNSGKFNEQLLAEIASCKDFLVVLPEHALDRCSDADDWVRREVCCAMQHDKNIIPVMLRGFSWPEPMPEGMEELKNYQAVAAASHEYFDLSMQRLAGYLKSRPYTKYRTTTIRTSIIVAAVVLCAVAAYAVLRMLSVPVCIDAANKLTAEMETVNQLAGINRDMQQQWDDYYQSLVTAKTPQRVQNLRDDMKASLDNCRRNVTTLQEASAGADFTYGGYETFLLSLRGIDKTELTASTVYVSSLYGELLDNIAFMSDNIENTDCSILLDKSMTDGNFKCYQYSVNAFYYAYMELMSHMPRKSLSAYAQFAEHWDCLPDEIPLTLTPEEYQRRQQREFGKIDELVKALESDVGKRSDEIDMLARRLDELSSRIESPAQRDDAGALVQAEINARMENINANREYIELRKKELAEIDRKYEESYTRLREQCQLKEDDHPDYMWGKIVHWGHFLGTIALSRSNAERQGIYSSSSVTPARALAEMNSLLSCYQTYNPESAAFIPSVKAFFQGVASCRYPLRGVLIFGFKDDAVHPLYRAGDIVTERNGVAITDYSQLLEAAKLADGGTVKFLRMDNGRLREYSGQVPQTDVLVGYMELTESE